MNFVTKEDLVRDPEYYYSTYIYLSRCDEFVHPNMQKMITQTANGRARLLCWMGGVRSLKTSSIMTLCGWHLTGVYPNGENTCRYNPGYVYDGFRYKRPTKIMIVAERSALMASTLQMYLLRGMGSFRSPDLMYVTYGRKVSSTGAYGELHVPHWTDGKYDGDSVAIFKTVMEGDRSFQSYCGIDCIFIDEEPTFPVFEECMCRLPAMHLEGKEKDYTFLYLTMCPNHGETQVVSMFTKNAAAEELANSRYYTHSGWDQNPFMDDEERAEMEARTPPHLLPARKFGLPIFGVGKVFTFNSKEILVNEEERKPIPPYYRLIMGLDPAATLDGTWGGILLAVDPDTKDLYILREYLKSGLTFAEHGDNIRKEMMEGFSDQIPIICDPAGGGEDTETRKSALEYLRDKFQFNITEAYKAAYAKEAACSKVYHLWRNKKIHVYPCCTEFQKEFDKYSRDEKNRIMKVDDHILDALFYALNKIDLAISMDEISGMSSGGYFTRTNRADWRSALKGIS